MADISGSDDGTEPRLYPLGTATTKEVTNPLEELIGRRPYSVLENFCKNFQEVLKGDLAKEDDKVVKP